MIENSQQYLRNKSLVQIFNIVLISVVECSANNEYAGQRLQEKAIVLVRLCVYDSLTHREMGGGSRERETERNQYCRAAI